VNVLLDRMGPAGQLHAYLPSDDARFPEPALISNLQ
jgi:hypothetical protein